MRGTAWVSWAVVVVVMTFAAALLRGEGRPAAAEATPLQAGCNQVVSTFPDGASPAVIAGAVAPAAAVRGIWRWEAAPGRFVGYAPGGAAVADLRVVNHLDVLWLCVSEPAQLGPPTGSAAAAVLHCVALAQPVGRSANVWSVDCRLRGAPPGDTSFAVTAFAPDRRPVCTGTLSGGAGRCGSVLSVAFEETLSPLRFYARTQPSGTTAADQTPEVRPQRGR